MALTITRAFMAAALAALVSTYGCEGCDPGDSGSSASSAASSAAAGGGAGPDAGLGDGGGDAGALACQLLPTPYEGQWDECASDADCAGTAMTCRLDVDPAVGRCAGPPCNDTSECPPTNECAGTWCNANYPAMGAQGTCLETSPGSGYACPVSGGWCTATGDGESWDGRWMCCPEEPACLVMPDDESCYVFGCPDGRVCIDGYCCNTCDPAPTGDCYADGCPDGGHCVENNCCPAE